MYKELIESCRACATGDDTNCDRCMFCGKNEHGEDSRFQKLHKASADAIEELSKPKWIPVTERLPEAGERVLCYCRANIYEVLTGNMSILLMFVGNFICFLLGCLYSDWRNKS